MRKEDERTGALMEDRAFTLLKGFLIEHTGLEYYRDKDRVLAEKVARRMSVLDVDRCSTYLDHLRNGEGSVELDALVAECTIGETYFFRHVEQLEGLTSLALPELLERNRDTRALRIWSAGCATGAEPYTLAILLDREFHEAMAGWNVRILGTDINRRFLRSAEEGRFGEWALRATPEEVRREYFRREENTWILRRPLKEFVSFRYHNLVSESFVSLVHELGPFDLIVCRNVMIYLDRARSRSLIRRFHASLVEGGWLAVGHAETADGLYENFTAVPVPGATLYRKGPGATPGREDASGLARKEVAPSPWTPLYRGRDESTPSPTQSPPWPADQPAAPPAPSLPDVPKVPFPGTEAGERGEETEGAAPGLGAVRELADQGEWEAAAAGVAELLDRSPLDPRAHLLQGLIQDHLGEEGESERSVRRAIYLDRELSLAHYQLGVLLLRGKRAREAGRWLRNALRVLSSRRDDEEVPDGDGMTVADLRELIRIHLERT